MVHIQVQTTFSLGVAPLQVVLQKEVKLYKIIQRLIHKCFVRQEHQTN